MPGFIVQHCMPKGPILTVANELSGAAEHFLPFQFQHAGECALAEVRSIQLSMAVDLECPVPQVRSHSVGREVGWAKIGLQWGQPGGWIGIGNRMGLLCQIQVPFLT